MRAVEGVFMAHWREECQHAMMDELEWLREDARLNAAERDAIVGDLIELVVAVNGILLAQAARRCELLRRRSRPSGTSPRNAAPWTMAILKAYRWQYIVSGVMEPRFQKILFRVLDDRQAARVRDCAPAAAPTRVPPDRPVPLQ